MEMLEKFKIKAKEFPERLDVRHKMKKRLR
jgi:hypothetical protein